MDTLTKMSKALLVSLFAAISLRLNALEGLLGTFIAAMLLDYITGMAAAMLLNNLSSKIGLRGILKKLGTCVAVAVALLADDVASLSCAKLGLGFTTGGAIACIVTVWLILNELISILENLRKMNVSLPPFLLAGIKLLQKQTEEKAEKPKDEETQTK